MKSMKLAYSNQPLTAMYRITVMRACGGGGDQYQSIYQHTRAKCRNETPYHESRPPAPHLLWLPAEFGCGLELLKDRPQGMDVDSAILFGIMLLEYFQ